jgi:hypothetical protein
VKDRFPDIGPSAPWYGAEAIEYVGDEVLFRQTIDAAVQQLTAQLEARVQRIQSEGVPVHVLIEEISAQMTVASANGLFSETRELHDLVLQLRLVESSKKRAV